MPYARNAIDGTHVYFEDHGGGGAPVVLYGGLVDPVEAVRMSPIAQALPADEFRQVHVDHRGVGRSGKPHERVAYAMRFRVADAVSVLDALGVARAHFVGTSYGGRLCFGVGEHARERVLSLVIGGQQPYRMDPDSALGRLITESLAASRAGGTMEPFVNALEQLAGCSATRGQASAVAGQRSSRDRGRFGGDAPRGRCCRGPSLVGVPVPPVRGGR